MSAQYGKWNFDGCATPTDFLDRVGTLLAPYGPEGESRHSTRGIDLIWRSFETAEERPIRQPRLLESGEVLVWDGRLDNREELALATGIPGQSCDVEIVAAAWSRWQENCLAKLIGDWALTIWNPKECTLHLSVDFMATRHVFYRSDPNSFEWCTVLDPLVLYSERNLSLDDRYLAGWLDSFPGADLTAFQGIRRVAPSSVITVRPGSCKSHRYWAFDGGKRIQYRRNKDYQDEFLELLSASVRRRLRTAFPVIAELSGGMDSSSIVCVADRLTTGGGSPSIDTLSYFNNQEPHWNELPWLTCVERKRGKAGLHIDLSSPPSADAQESFRFVARPGASSWSNQFLESMKGNGHRVLLSGVGGDEFLGGVPTPLPELEDLLVQGRLVAMSKRLLAWALVQRRPWIHLARDLAVDFLFSNSSRARNDFQSSHWLRPAFAPLQQEVLHVDPGPLKWLGPLPSFQECIHTLGGIRRQLGCKDLTPGYPYETRYPFLDRDLLEFLFAIPRDQLVRPGERRSMMRRALRGIVPEEILNRRRKAYVIRSLLLEAGAQYESLSRKRGLTLEALGIVTRDKFLNALRTAGQGTEPSVIPLLRACALEKWLNGLDALGLLRGREVPKPAAIPPEREIELAQI